jgi:putative Ca2+/H+ antiporter (TMEM165/GDT1 family)
MDALMGALVAALLAQASDRPAWMAARIADQFSRRGAVIVGVALALGISNALGAAGGALIAPMMTPNARALLLGLALLSAGASACWPPKPLPQSGGATLGASATAFILLLATSLGDRTQFLTAAIAVRSDLPVYSAIGATLGGLAIHIPAILAGSKGKRRLPLHAIRIAIALVLLLAGSVAVLSAMRLI